jgi:hypothetical protein
MLAALLLAVTLAQPVSGAVALLGGSLPADVTITTMDATNEKLARLGVVEVAYTRPGVERVIYVNTWTDVYRNAQRGDRAAMIALAAVLAHEAYHLEHGAAERPAYDEQLRVLRSLGASEHVNVDTLVKRIERAREYVK